MLSGIKVWGRPRKGPRPRKGWEEAQKARKGSKRPEEAGKRVKEDAQWD